MTQLSRDVLLLISYDQPPASDAVGSVDIRYQLIENGAASPPLVMNAPHDDTLNQVSLSLTSTTADSVKIDIAFNNSTGQSTYTFPIQDIVLPTTPVPGVASGVIISAV